MKHEIQRLEWLAARALEPEPGRPGDEDAGFVRAEGASPVGLYRVVALYEEGDVPRWQPLAFASSGDAMLALIDVLGAAGWAVDTHAGRDIVRAVVRDRDGNEAGRAELRGPATRLPEAVLRAVCAALPGLDPRALNPGPQKG